MVKGLKSLEMKLTRTIPEHVRKAAEKALEKSANEIVTSMRSFVPVDTGVLRDTINWTWGSVPKGAFTVAKSPPVGPGGRRITVYAGDERTNIEYDGRVFSYAFMQEYGTTHHAASPFFFPAWRLNKQRSARRLTREVRKAIREGAK